MSEEKWTPGPWSLCQHLKSVKDDLACSCGYRGVIYGPDPDFPMAVCQPGHDPDRPGEEWMGPARYPRATEIANAHLIASAPDLYAALAAIEYQMGNEGPAVKMRFADARKAARAALSKARGG